jgi:hypothetical protein
VVRRGAQIVLCTPALALRSVCAIAAVFAIHPAPALAAVCAAFVFVYGTAIRQRLVLGLDGGDQMQAILWAGVFLFAIAPSNIARGFALVLVGGQLLLSYLASGLAKACSSQWRDGTALLGILTTRSYGSALLSRVVCVPGVAVASCWTVIGFELVAPLIAVTASGNFLLIFALAAVMFHACIALSMGLNNFLWAFCAALPAFIYVGLLVPNIA